MVIDRLSTPNEALLFLIRELDKELAVRDGEEHAFYAQYNGLDDISNFVIGTVDQLPVACGAFKHFESHTVEIKRMFVVPDQRGFGLARLILGELEDWAKEKGYQSIVLETGIKQPEAIRLYEKYGYKRIPNFGPYVGGLRRVFVSESLCKVKGFSPSQVLTLLVL